MISEKEVVSYYQRRDLYNQVMAGLSKAGINQPNIQDLSAVDEFHIGGIEGTRLVADALGPTTSKKSRYWLRFSWASTLYCRNHGVSCHEGGVGLTKSFIRTGNRLNQLVGLEKQVLLNSSNALPLPFTDGYFDGAYMIHVGMNIADKSQLKDVAERAIKPGGRFVIYDIMQMKEATLTYTLP